MKIVLVVTCLGMGGGQRQICDLADEFVKFGHKVLLISLSSDIVIRPRTSDVEVISLNMSKSSYGILYAYFKMRKLISDFKPDIIHSHLVHANIFVRLLRVSLRITKIICTSHSSNEGGFSRMLAYRLTDRLCDLSTSVSQEALEISIKRGAVSANRMIVTPNGIDTKIFNFDPLIREQLRSELNLDADSKLILSVGRFTSAKDYPNLLYAFSKLVKLIKNVQLAIIGAGEEQPSIVELITQLELTNHVKFLGLRRNVNEWMTTADVYVMSSAWEGMPLVLLEAMACERVVVATDCGGVKEVLGDCGFLVSPKDSEKLAGAMHEALLLSDNESQRLGIRARQRIKNSFSLPVVAKKWLELYKK